MFVWDWKAGAAAASNKITTKVYAVSLNNNNNIIHYIYLHLLSNINRFMSKGKSRIFFYMLGIIF